MTDHPIIKNVERALDYIAVQLNEDRAPHLDEVARESGISKFHFHRMFKLITGESCAEVITRLRLARGSAALTDTSTSITESAFIAGYGSSQAFAKAIKREMGQSASEIRQDAERLASTIQTLCEPVDADNVQHIAPTRIEICSLDPLDIILIHTKGVYLDLAETYGELWNLADNPADIVAVLGMPLHDIETFEDPDFEFKSAIALSSSVSNLPDHMKRETIKGGEYLLVRHQGLDADIPKTLNALYAFILANPDITLSDTPCLHHYIDDPEEVEEALCRTDIYVGVERVAR